MRISDGFMPRAAFGQGTIHLTLITAVSIIPVGHGRRKQAGQVCVQPFGRGGSGPGPAGILAQQL